MTGKRVAWLVAAQVLGWCALAAAQMEAVESQEAPVSTSFQAESISDSADIAASTDATGDAIEDATELRRLIREVLHENPDIARAEQRAAAAAARAPQVAALPDPVAALTLFVLPPETRVGPQRFTLGIQQQLPWLGKLSLKEQAALYAAAAAKARVEDLKLDLVVEARRLAYELAFLEQQRQIIDAEHATLVRFEQAAQARYAAGTGLQQESIRIQAQITRVETQQLDIAERRSMLVAGLNRLRNRPAEQEVGHWTLPTLSRKDYSTRSLVQEAIRRSPKLAAVEAEIAAGHALIELAEKNFRPNLTLGLSYTAVQGRRDSAGRINPPEGNGDDVLALTGSVNLPVWRRKLEAGVEEAHATARAAEAHKDHVLAGIESSVGDLTTRLPLLFQHLDLLEKVLLKQADEALRSAEIAYSTGKLNAVDLLDAEVMLFEVRISAARVRADLAIALAQLDRAVARPVGESARNVSPESPTQSHKKHSDPSPAEATDEAS